MNEIRHVNEIWNRALPEKDILQRGFGSTVRANGAELSLSAKELRELPGALVEAIFGLEQRKAPEGPVADIDASVRATNAAFVPGGLCLPISLLRSLVTTTGSAGGFLVGTEVSNDIDMALRPFSAAVKAGARVLTGLKGDLVLVQETSGTTLSWLHVLETITSTDSVLGALRLTPHRLAGATSLDRQLDKQTAGIALGFIVQSLLEGIGSALDTAALVGTGVLGQPSGLYAAAGVGTVTFAGAPSLIKVLDYEGQLATNNAVDERISFIAHPDVREKWKATQKWTNASVALWSDDERVSGKPAFVTTSMGSSDICAGQWDKMVIAFWNDALQVLNDPYSQSLNSRISLVVNAFGDTGVLRPNLFVKNLDSAVQ